MALIETPSILENGYMPAMLPRPPSRIAEYTVKVMRAPTTALRGVDVKCVEPRTPKSRSRIRLATGSTNRWRLPQSLGGDLLGSSQAVRATTALKNNSIIRAMTADSSAISVSKNTDFFDGNWGLTPLPVRSFSSLSKDDIMYSRKFRSQLTSHQSSRIPPQSSLSLQSRTPYSSSAKTSRTRFKDPVKVLEMFSRLANQEQEPDVVLHCLNQTWQLHRAYLVKSAVLQQLLDDADNEKRTRIYNDEAAQQLDNFVSSNGIYSQEYRDVTRRLTSKDVEGIRLGTKSKGTLTHPVVNLKLASSDPWITRHALAIGLGHLYLDESIVATGDAVETLAVACNLKFHNLISGCCNVMINNLATDTVCVYLEAATRYEQQQVVSACERWLELNLISQLSSTVYLRDVPEKTLEKVMKSSKLFIFNEYSLYKTLCYWLFMQLHTDVHFLPSQTEVMTFFSTLNKSCAFLEKEEGAKYNSVFSCLRLHGITDTKHLQDVMYMNIIPQSWLLKVLSHHYHALQGGGDMSFLLNFSLGSTRFGFMLDHDPGYHCEIISLHGFHFEAKAQRHGSNDTYIAYIQRLRPTDPSLTFRACERATFSMRRDRLVRYQLTVQHPSRESGWTCETTGILEQRFGLDHRTARSQVLKITDVRPPIYVSFSMFFPPS